MWRGWSSPHICSKACLVSSLNLGSTIVWVGSPPYKILNMKKLRVITTQSVTSAIATFFATYFIYIFVIPSRPIHKNGIKFKLLFPFSF